jgi:hypothetical protein
MLASTPPAIGYKALVQDDRIHASLYTDPHIFADERERIFKTIQSQCRRVGGEEKD